MTDTQVRHHFKLILAKLQLQDANLTFHAFRHSGATYTFNANVALQDIQSHGTWTSECVWKYITMDHNASDQVARAFQQNLHSTTYLGFLFLHNKVSFQNFCSKVYKKCFPLINYTEFIKLTIKFSPPQIGVFHIEATINLNQIISKFIKVTLLANHKIGPP